MAELTVTQMMVLRAETVIGHSKLDFKTGDGNNGQDHRVIAGRVIRVFLKRTQITGLLNSRDKTRKQQLLHKIQ